MNCDNKLPIELNERIVTTRMKNDEVQKCIRTSDDEIAKLWLCRDFIFRKDHFLSQQTKNITTDVQLTITNKTKINSNAKLDVTNDNDNNNENISEKKLVY